MEWYEGVINIVAVVGIATVVYRILQAHRRIDRRMEGILSRVANISSALSPVGGFVGQGADGTIYRQTATRKHVQEVEKQGNTTRDDVTALAARVAVLECAAKGHGKTRTVTEEERAYAREFEKPALIEMVAGLGATGDLGTRTTVTCLDCGAVLSDKWEPKEADDDPA